MKGPLAIDLFCGLGGWTEGLLAEGYYVVGFDIERHCYGDARYPSQLVIQDVRTIHGSQFKHAALIVASPPCQEYSYMAMPWSRAKQIEREYQNGARDVKQLTALFDACFRIQREAIEAAGHHIPLVVENVRGAQKWVGSSKWNCGSMHFCGETSRRLCRLPHTSSSPLTREIEGPQADGSMTITRRPTVGGQARAENAKSGQRRLQWCPLSSASTSPMSGTQGMPHDLPSLSCSCLW